MAPRAGFHLARLSTLLFPLPFSPLPERMGCCTASCAGQLSRDAGTEHCSWLLTRNGEVSDNGVQNKTGILCFLKHRISCVFRESSMREFQVDGRTISGYLAVPEQGSGPGVLVLHAWWGLTEPFRQVCDRLAEAGFVAFAPDLYHGKTTASVEEAQALGAALDQDVERWRGDITAAVGVLHQHTATHLAGRRGKLAFVGFSLGDAYALDMSVRMYEQIAPVVVFYS